MPNKWATLQKSQTQGGKYCIFPNNYLKKKKNKEKNRLCGHLHQEAKKCFPLIYIAPY